MAKLRYFYGCMGSAKTLRLLTTAYNFDERNIVIGVLKPSKDTRDGEGIIHSRIGVERKCVSITPNMNLFEYVKEYQEAWKKYNKEVKFILVDECQFLEEKQVEQLAKVVDQLSISVFCYGLRTDFQTRLFPGAKRLFELADEIEEIPSMCECGNKTSINARFDDDKKLITDGEQVLIGGNESYKAICRSCYYNLKRLKEKET